MMMRDSLHNDIRIPAPAGILHIFNPEADYALASGSPFYTPPASVIALRRKMALLPLTYAESGDSLLLLDNTSDSRLADIRAQRPDVEIITPDDIPAFSESHSDKFPLIQPWGWNPAIRHNLILAGIPIEALPSAEDIDYLRKISHRRITLDFNRRLNELLIEKGIDPKHVSPLPHLFTDVDEAIQWEAQNHPAFFKAPWSSSGRGIIFTDQLESEKHLRPLLRGVLRRQGSFLGETAADKRLDFAAEFLISGKAASCMPDVRFIGLSVFEASRRGKYHSNIAGSQKRLLEIIRSAAPDFSPDFIDAQAQTLRETAGAYRGYCGIDMLADSSGAIRGCIEINFRLTMGIVNLLRQRFRESGQPTCQNPSLH